MSTQGSIRRNWFSAEVYTERRYYDGDPDQTIGAAVVRVGRVEVTFNRWPGGRVTHRKDWKVFPGKGYVLGRTPWGNWGVLLDAGTERVQTSGDIDEG